MLCPAIQQCGLLWIKLKMKPFVHISCFNRFSPTGETVASCDKDGIVKIWTYEPTPSTIATVMSRSPFLSLEWCNIANFVSHFHLILLVVNMLLWFEMFKSVLLVALICYPFDKHFVMLSVFMKAKILRL